ncbi:hypothetical protein K438DRAFT_1831740, partial [Mycena galopus ATCC 62051]
MQRGCCKNAGPAMDTKNHQNIDFDDSNSETTLENPESTSEIHPTDTFGVVDGDTEAAPPQADSSKLKPRIAFSFGAHDSFFVENSQSWMYRAPSRCQNISYATEIAWNGLKIVRVYGVSLSDNYGFYLAYEAEGGAKNRVFVCPKLGRRPRFGKGRKFWHSNQTALSKLKTWILTHIATDSELQTACVVLGPQYSYFARSGNAMIWHNLPSALETMIESKRSKDASCVPTQLSLGWQGAWAAIWPDGTDGVDLLGHYTTLAESMKKFDDPLSFITLNAFNPDEFISCFGKTTFLDKGPAPLLKMFRPFQQQMANMANATLSMRRTTTTTLTMWSVEPKAPEPTSNGTLKRLKPDGSGEEVLERVETAAAAKKSNTEAKVLAGVVIIGLAAGCVV